MKHLRKLLAVCALLAFGLALLIACSSCAHTSPGLEREAAAYSTATNAVAFVARYVAPLVPAPYNGVVPLVMGAVGAALGAWSLSQEKRLAALKAGTAAKT